MKKIEIKGLDKREHLAVQRTILSNQSTILAFVRTSMYFTVAGMTIRNLIPIEHAVEIEYVFYLIASMVLGYGIYNFHHQMKVIQDIVDM